MVKGRGELFRCAELKTQNHLGSFLSFPPQSVHHVPLPPPPALPCTHLSNPSLLHHQCLSLDSWLDSCSRLLNDFHASSFLISQFCHQLFF